MSKKTRTYSTPQKALDAVCELYELQTGIIRAAFDDFVAGKEPKNAVRAFYPQLCMNVKNMQRTDTRLSYGFAPRTGLYSTTLTRPDLFARYYKEQFELLLENHDAPLEVGLSDTPIPVHFALGEGYHLEKNLDPEKLSRLPALFDVPDLDIMDDEIANGVYMPAQGTEQPLSLFTAPRVDISLQRLKHYCGTAPKHFQNFVIFTNYQFYIDEFISISNDLVRNSGADGYSAFVEPGEKITVNGQVANNPDQAADGAPLKRMPQMPAYHLKRADGTGITMINIGVGPSNAKTITDHVAVVRPHAWLMLGHCAGLRNSQQLGDYVLAHGYLRDDHILDRDLPLSIPVPALAEIQQALEKAVSEVTGYEGYELKKVMRTGTVATTDDRNWELRAPVNQITGLSQSRAIAMDMESGTIAANGFRFRVPYGTLLCVSDKPLHGQLKLPGMADDFYRQRVDQHLQIGLRTMEFLRELPLGQLHSRKLRSFNEVAFQ